MQSIGLVFDARKRAAKIGASPVKKSKKDAVMGKSKKDAVMGKSKKDAVIGKSKKDAVMGKSKKVGSFSEGGTRGDSVGEELEVVVHKRGRSEDKGDGKKKRK